MKSLQNFIEDFDFDILDLQILKHSNIYYAFNKENISEYFTFESLGLFDGCKEIVNYILDNINDLIKDDSVIINSKGISNKCFFETIELSFKNDKSAIIHGEYEIGYQLDNNHKDYESKKWNKDKQIFNFIKINCYNFKNGSDNEIAEILTHELIHAWDDYILHKKSYNSLRDKNLNNKLKKEFNEIKQNLKNEKIFCIINGEHDKAKDISNKLNDFSFIEQLIYYLDKFEINAYIGQINQILRKRKFKTIKDSLDYIINNSVTYHNYKYIYELAFIDNDNIFIENGATKEQLNKIRKLISKAWKKIINHTYHICVDNVEEKLNEGSSLVLLENKSKKIWKR